MTQAFTYDQMFRVADKLWPGEAAIILENPTDEQLDMILAVLRSSPVDGVVQAGWALSNLATANHTSW